MGYGMNECHITLLPQYSCAHCTGAKDLVFEPTYERKDYAQLEITDRQVKTVLRSHGRDENDRLILEREDITIFSGMDRQTDVQPAQFTDHVDFKDIYGGGSTHTPLRIQAKKV